MRRRAHARGALGLALVAGLLAAACALPAPAAARRAPRVDQMVVLPSGKAIRHTVKAKGVRVKVGRKRCATGTGTPLAALLRSRPGKVKLKDYGSCSRRAADGGGLFVRALRGVRNKGQNGWVYKVGRKAATAGAGDPTGPFGRGRLRSRARVTWFYCYMKDASCQRTLVVKAWVTGKTVNVRVSGYDDAGHRERIEGADAHMNGASAVTAADGLAQFETPPGRYRVHASKQGLVRSFAERVIVK